MRNNGEEEVGKKATFVISETIQQNQLIDIGLEGVSCTQCNEWDLEREIREILDRMLVSRKWSDVFEKAKCLHIVKEVSDHVVPMIDTKPADKRRKISFHFEGNGYNTRKWME